VYRFAPEGRDVIAGQSFFSSKLRRSATLFTCLKRLAPNEREIPWVGFRSYKNLAPLEPKRIRCLYFKSGWRMTTEY
jgi:hypothetical protein